MLVSSAEAEVLALDVAGVEALSGFGVLATDGLVDVVPSGAAAPDPSPQPVSARQASSSTPNDDVRRTLRILIPVRKCAPVARSPYAGAGSQGPEREIASG